MQESLASPTDFGIAYGWNKAFYSQDIQLWQKDPKGQRDYLSLAISAVLQHSTPCKSVM